MHPFPETKLQRDLREDREARERLSAKLRAVMLDALLHDAGHEVPCGNNLPSPAFDVVIASMYGRSQVSLRSRLMAIVQQAATQKENAELQELALRFVADMADQYAEEFS